MTPRRAFLTGLILGAILGGILIANSVELRPKPQPETRFIFVNQESHEPPQALTDDETAGLSERERFLFKRFAEVADKRAERAVEQRGPGIVHRIIGEVIDDATDSIGLDQPKKGGIISILGWKLWEFIKKALLWLLDVSIVAALIRLWWKYPWLISGAFVVAVSFVFWANKNIRNLWT